MCVGRGCRCSAMNGCSNVAYRNTMRVASMACRVACRPPPMQESNKSLQEQQKRCGASVKRRRLPLSPRVHPSHRSDDSSVLASTWRQWRVDRTAAPFPRPAHAQLICGPCTRFRSNRSAKRCANSLTPSPQALVRRLAQRCNNQHDGGRRGRALSSSPSV